MIAMRNTTNSTEIRAYDGQTCQYEPSREQIFQAYKRRLMTAGEKPGMDRINAASDVVLNSPTGQEGM